WRQPRTRQEGRGPSWCGNRRGRTHTRTVPRQSGRGGRPHRWNAPVVVVSQPALDVCAARQPCRGVDGRRGTGRTDGPSPSSVSLHGDGLARRIVLLERGDGRYVHGIGTARGRYRPTSVVHRHHRPKRRTNEEKDDP